MFNNDLTKILEWINFFLSFSLYAQVTLHGTTLVNCLISKAWADVALFADRGRFDLAATEIFKIKNMKEACSMIFLQELKLEASRLCCVSEKKSILLQKGNGDLCNFTPSRFMAELHER